MAFNDNLKAITQDYLAPKVVDTVLTGNVVAMKLLGNAKKWSGEQMTKGVIVTKQNNGGSFSGLDTFNTNKVSTKIKLAFDPKGLYMPVVIEGMERDVNASDPSRAADLVKEAMEEAGNALLDLFADKIYGEALSTSDDPQGLGSIVDDGGEVATYGGKSRATYTTLKGNETDVTGNLSSLSPLRTSEMLAKVGSDKVDLHVTSETKWNEFEALLQPQVQLNLNTDGYRQVTRDKVVASKAALGGEAGFDALFYRGAPVVADEKCPDLKWYGLNLKHLNWYGLKSSKHPQVVIGNNKEIEGAYSDNGISKTMGVHFTGLMDSINQYGEVGYFIILGNLISWNPNRHFVINFTS